MIRNLIIALVLLIPLSGCGQKNQFTDHYNLDFKTQGKMGKWKINSIMPMVLEADSSVERGRKSITISQSSFNGMNFPLKGGIQQYILMPKTSSDSAEIFLTCKSRNLAMARLVVTGLGAGEEVLGSDTLMVSGREDWHTFSIPVSLKGVEFLHFNIEVKGKGDNLEQKLYLDVLNIKIGNKYIDDFPMRDLDDVRIKDKKQVHNLSFSNSETYNSLTELREHKVVAFGETLHGSENVNQAAFQLLKHQIQHNQTNLVLMELPLGLTLSYNRFVQGDENFHIDSLMGGFNTFYSPAQFSEFLQWLKEYNSDVKDHDKVWFLGMDMDPITQGSAMSLVEYVYKINLGAKEPLLDSVCRQLFKSDPYGEVLNILGKSTEMEAIFGATEYQLFEHALRTLEKAGGSSALRYNNRDNYMFENAKFLIDLLSPPDKKVAMYAHLGHVGYLGSASGDINHAIAGSMLKRAFNDDYFVVSLITEKGSFLSADPQTIVNKCPLEIPPVNSLESLFDRIDGDYFYLPVSAVSGNLAAVRDLASIFRERQFGIGSPKSRMGAIVFVRNSVAVSLDRQPRNENEVLFERMQRNSKLIRIQKQHNQTRSSK